jgi:hypothetical protein
VYTVKKLEREKEKKAHTRKNSKKDSGIYMVLLRSLKTIVSLPVLGHGMFRNKHKF